VEAAVLNSSGDRVIQRFHTSERTKILSKGAEQICVKGTVLGPEIARPGELLEASLFRDPRGMRAESVIRIERLISNELSPERQRESVEIKLVLAGDTPQARGESFAKAKAALSRYTESEHKELGQLLVDLRRAGCGLHELTAKDATIVLPKGQPAVFDGLTLKDCENLSIKSERDPSDRVKGRFSAVAHGLVIDGAKGCLALEGIDASGLTLRNLGHEQLSMLLCKQCQLRNSCVEGQATIGVLSAVDCCFGSRVDFLGLSMKNPPQNATEFKALFGGTIWDARGVIKLHPSFGFESNKEILVALSGEKVPRLLLQPPSEAYLTHILKSSAVFDATFSREPAGGEVARYTLPAADEMLSFLVAQDQRGKVVTEMKYLGSAASENSILYSRNPDDSIANAMALEELIVKLRAVRSVGPKAGLRRRAFELMSDNSEGPEVVLERALRRASET
jgi:hypothetical protein